MEDNIFNLINELIFRVQLQCSFESICYYDLFDGKELQPVKL